MIYNLESISFENDFSFIDLDNGDTIALNLVDEDFFSEGEEIAVNTINISVVVRDVGQLTGTNIIGMGNDYYELKTDYTEYLGKVLTKDNLPYCVLEVKNG